MTSADQDKTSLDQNPDYYEALAHLHRGEWDECVCLTNELGKRYGTDARLKRLLDEAQFKSDLDENAKVRAKRFIIPWRKIVFAGAFVVTLVAILSVGTMVVNRGLRPIMAQAADRRTQGQLLADAQAYLTAGEWDLAEEKFDELLALAPDNADALEGLATIAEERALRAIYDDAVDDEEDGETEAALQKYMELQTRRAGYLDTSERIARLRRWQDIDAIYADAQGLIRFGLTPMAARRLEQAQSLDISYRRNEIAPTLSGLYVGLAHDIIESEPVQLQQIPVALDLLDKAVKLDGNNDEALSERRLARLFEEAREFARRHEWHLAVGRFQAIYEERPGYLGGSVAGMLYDAYVGSGDLYRDANDCTLAYGEYGKATQLPVDDTTVAKARMTEVTACLTPTPTPSNTPLPTEPPPPTGTPTATPTPIPLQQFRGKIAFKSDNPDQPGIWVVNPDGSGRQYLGTVDAYEKQLEFLREEETWSPDHTLRVYVTDLDASPQIFIDYSQHPQFSSIGNKAITRMTGMAYDPVWSPDGGSIAYVTQENESDDIWLMNADGSKQRSLMRNDWEWDKHPSWSPDSTLIAFFSNRNGLKQIYVMDTNGKVLRNLSSVGWDEYDPIWIK